MNPAVDFNAMLSSKGFDLSRNSIFDGLKQFEEFQQQQKYVSDLIPDSDMILIQWGLYEFNGGKTFLIDFVRQFIREDDDGDQEISQFHLRYHLDPNLNAQPINTGNKWFSNETPSNDDEIVGLLSGFDHSIIKSIEVEHEMV